MERVLFVDDSRLMRFAAGRFLQPAFEVVLAENGLQAWDLLRKDPKIAAVITDLIMPEVDGVELIHRIRCASDERIRTLPILAVTSMEENRGRSLAMDAGANDLVPKPFSDTDLIEPTREYLRRSVESMMHPARPSNLRPTRAALIDTLEQVASFHDRIARAYSIIHLRVDNHAAVSSRHGEKWAESLMRHVERVVAREVRLEDSVGRSAKDVLSMVLMSTEAAGAKRLRDRVRDHLAANPARLPGTTLAIQASFSVQCPNPKNRRGAEATLRAGLDRLAEPANVTRLADRFRA